MSEPKFDFQDVSEKEMLAEIIRLYRENRMPSLGEVLRVVGEVRAEFRPKILAARKRKGTKG
jgi:hypothetical protein